MTKIDIYEVVQKLVGSIEPIGETNADEARYENLVEMMFLVERLFHDISRLRHFDKRTEFSIKRAGVRAGAFIDEMVEEYNHDES